MTIRLELPPDLEARFLNEAKAKGLPVDEVIKTHLYQSTNAAEQGRLSAEEVDGGFEEAAELVPEGIPVLSDEALRRENVYTREDNWKD